MQSANVSSKCVLEDEDYFVALDDRRAEDMSDGQLQRKCLVSSGTPGGVSCVGSFGQDLNGTWSAKIAAPFDPVTGCDCEVVSQGVERLDAVVALWRARHRAYLGYHSL